MSEKKIVKPEDCPEPFWHDTHRYCPACSWTEPVSDEHTKRTARYTPPAGEAEKDTREWTLSNRPYGHDPLASYITEGPELATDEMVEVVPKAALSAVEAERENERELREAHYMTIQLERERAERAEAALSAVEAERDRAVAGRDRAIASLNEALDEAKPSEALDLIEKLLGTDWRTIPEEQLSEDEQAARRLLLEARGAR